jgi:hypothetical protein
MSTAYYPQGMRGAMPASGYNHHSTYYNKEYLTWKGRGPFSNPTGSASGHIRPLTNHDPGNVFPTGFNLPRPIKHYRKGRVIPIHPLPISSSNTEVQNGEIGLINYNLNRFVLSSKGTSLGGGFGGSGLLNDLQDKPGAYIVKLNEPAETNSIEKLDAECKRCESVGVVVNYYPNNTYLTDNPEPNVENPRLCCNQEYKARKRVIYANTNLPKNYYTTTKQYLQNRCQTYDQKAYNFQTAITASHTANLLETDLKRAALLANANAGSPLALLYTDYTNNYVANCFPNLDIYDATEEALILRFLDILLKNGTLTQEQIVSYKESPKAFNFDNLLYYLNSLPEEVKVASLAAFALFIENPYLGVPFSGPSHRNGCKLTVYKPSNYKYAVQGSVMSSTRMLKLNVDTITKNAKSVKDDYSNILKNKPSNSNTTWPLNFSQSRQFQNKKFCHYPRTAPEYQLPRSQPSPYRYYYGTVFNTNHYSQSPNTYNTTTGTSQYDTNTITN